MGQTIQKKNYVIVFGASWETFEDTLSFFDCDLREYALLDCRFSRVLDTVTGVHSSDLTDDCSYMRGYRIGNRGIEQVTFSEPQKPALVHFLHFGSDSESRQHQLLSNRLASGGIPCLNPYDRSVRNFESKFRTAHLLGKQGVPTPHCRLVSRFNETRPQALKDCAKSFGNRPVFIQPDCGTEGEHCELVTPRALNRFIHKLKTLDLDLVVRPAVNTPRGNNENVVVRLNVTFDEQTYAAHSGYCLVGVNVVSVSHGARKANIHDAFSALRLNQKQIRQLQDTACRAVAAASENRMPPALTGVDLVLELGKPFSVYVIDLNPRPVVVGSRLVDERRIGLGQHFWQSVREKVTRSVRFAAQDRRRNCI
jgi:hypothetical protein